MYMYPIRFICVPSEYSCVCARYALSNYMYMCIYTCICIHISTRPQYQSRVVGPGVVPGLEAERAALLHGERGRRATAALLRVNARAHGHQVAEFVAHHVPLRAVCRAWCAWWVLKCERIAGECE